MQHSLAAHSPSVEEVLPQVVQTMASKVSIHNFVYRATGITMSVFPVSRGYEIVSIKGRILCVPPYYNFFLQ